MTCQWERLSMRLAQPINKIKSGLVHAMQSNGPHPQVLTSKSNQVELKEPFLTVIARWFNQLKASPSNLFTGLSHFKLTSLCRRSCHHQQIFLIVQLQGVRSKLCKILLFLPSPHHSFSCCHLVVQPIAILPMPFLSCLSSPTSPMLLNGAAEQLMVRNKFR